MLTTCNQLITCTYRNSTNHVQIIRVSTPLSAYLERVVMPNQCTSFSTSAEAMLEVHDGDPVSSLHADTIPCSELRSVTVDDYVRRDSNPLRGSLRVVA